MYASATQSEESSHSHDASSLHSRSMLDGKLVRPDPGPMNEYIADFAAVPRLPADTKVIVTMSSTPEGAISLNLILDSLLDQSYPPDEIHINLPKVSARGLGKYPDIFKFEWSWEQYRENGVKVFETQDLGALTNIIPTRKRVEDEKEHTLLIVVDDDKILPSSLVEDHVRAFQLDRDSASTCRGYKVTREMAEQGAQSEIEVDELEINDIGVQINERRRVGVVTGSDTWSVLASKFDSSLWVELDWPAPHGEIKDIGKLATLMNDIWVSGMLSRRFVKKFAIPCSYEVWDISTSLRTGIHSNTVGEVTEGLPALFKRREAKNAEVMRYFKNDWQEEELRD